MSGDKFLAGEASVWLQRLGPNTKPEYLGCHEVGDIDEPFGDVTPLYCPDPSRAGKWKISGSYQGEPGLPTTTITTDVRKVADLLERVRCPTDLIVHQVKCGRRDLFTNYDRSFLLSGATLTSRGLQGLAARDPGSEAETTQTFDLTISQLERIFLMELQRQTLAATQDVLAIAFCDQAKCADDCGAASDGCQYGVLVTKSSGASAGMPEVYYTIDGGLTWTATAADPFAVAEDISAVICFPISRTVTRILVARGTTDPANPAEVAYSDDNGATWHNVDLPGADGDFVVESEGLFALDYAHIWAVTDDGYINFSDDGGLTWTAQDAAVLAATGWNAIEFADSENGYVVGDTNELGKSVDGGDSWQVVTGPVAEAAANVTALEVLDANNVWIGYNNGHLYYTTDGGTTWTLRTVPVALTGIAEIEFYSAQVGFLVGNNATPDGFLLRTIDGGYTWEVITAPGNGGFQDLWVCDPNTAFVVGAVEGGTGFVGKAAA
jgi:photosystem II stability/assembly factor-like uncharacterized protein